MYLKSIFKKYIIIKKNEMKDTVNEKYEVKYEVECHLKSVFYYHIFDWLFIKL